MFAVSRQSLAQFALRLVPGVVEGIIVCRWTVGWVRGCARL